MAEVGPLDNELVQLEQKWFSQRRHRCRFDWGRRGATAAAERGDILVVVDTLSFSTTLTTAVNHGVIIYPCPTERKFELAKQVKAEVAVKRSEVPHRGRFSLSPQTFIGATAGTKVVLDSPNGSTCCLLGKTCPHVIIGCLLNARAVARYVNDLLDRTSLAVTVLACGERWLTPFDGEQIRMAVEDSLGAGAIFSNLNFDKSPEAEVSEAGFRSFRGSLGDALMRCGSGVELCDKGYENDVRHAAQLDLYDCVPLLMPDGSVGQVTSPK